MGPRLRRLGLPLWSLCIGITIGCLASHRFGDSPARGCPSSATVPPDEALSALLARMRGVNKDAEGFRTYPGDLVHEASLHWPEVGSALAAEKGIEWADKILLLDLVRQVGPEARVVLPQVMEFLRRDHETDHTAAALRSICADRDDVFRRLRHCASLPDPHARDSMTIVLGDMDGSFAQVSKAITPYLSDPDAHVRAGASRVVATEISRLETAMEEIESAAAWGAFHLDDSDGAVVLLERHGMLNGTTVDEMIRSIRSGEPNLTDERLSFILLTVPRFREGIQLRVAEMEADKNPRVRRWGVALDYAAIKNTRQRIVPRLRGMLKDAESSVREEAERALQGLGAE